MYSGGIVNQGAWIRGEGGNVLDGGAPTAQGASKAENGDRLVEAGSSPWTRVDGLHLEAPQHLLLFGQ